MAVDPLTALRSQVEDCLSDPDLEPSERRMRLRDLRERIVDVAGICDRYIDTAAKVEESASSAAARDVLWAREQADLREQLLADGVAAAELEEAGLPSHRELDELHEEGLLLEAAGEMRAAWDEAKHKRGEHGKFSHTDFFTPHPEQILASADRLRPTRTDPPEQVAKAAKLADEARRGLRAKRRPLDVRENGDGTLAIVDGNSTYAALKDQLTHFPVTIGQGSGEDAAVDRAAEEIHTAAVKAEPMITPQLKSVTTELGGKLEGAEHKLKSVESIKSKIRRKQEKYPGMTADRAGAKVLDSVRYTAVFPSSNYTDGVKRVTDTLAAQGFELSELKNYWGMGDDYDGVHAIFSGPGGVQTELQFHTPDSLKVKSQQNHSLYEQFRDSSDPKARYQLWTKMVENSSAVEKPPGVETLGPSRPSPSAEQRSRRQEAPGLAATVANGVR